MRSSWGILLAVAALVTVILLPEPEGLSIAGQRMLVVLAFAVMVWMTEALDYAVSAVVIAALMAFLLGLSPDLANPKVLQGTSAGPALAQPTIENDRAATYTALTVDDGFSLGVPFSDHERWRTATGLSKSSLSEIESEFRVCS